MGVDSAASKGTTKSLLGATGGSSSSRSADTSNSQSPPLYGATPKDTEDDSSQRSKLPVGEGEDRPARAEEMARDRIEAGSRDRVRELKSAREASLYTSPTASSPAAPPIPIRPIAEPTPHRPSPLPSYLRKLGYLLSLLLGSGAAVAALWSFFLLPLLHASFSARRALVEQQRCRMEEVLSRLKAIKGSKLFTQVSASSNPDSSRDAITGVGDGDKPEVDTKRVTVEEVPSSFSSDTGDQGSPPHNSKPLLPDFSPLASSLRTLSSARGNTSTTRTSLLSTLESYTSHLHRQLWAPRPGHTAFGGVGMSSLSANLARERGGRVDSYGMNGRLEDGGDMDIGLGSAGRGEDWDAVRREIRAIKAMLLNRRNFAIPGVGTR